MTAYDNVRVGAEREHLLRAFFFSLNRRRSLREPSPLSDMSKGIEPPPFTRWLLGAAMLSVALVPLFSRMLKGYKKSGKARVL